MNATIRVLGLGAVLLGLSTTAAARDAANDARARFESERADCISGRSHQDQATCLKEAGAALAAARRGNLPDAAAADYERNATLRCEALPADVRSDCETRMRRDDTASGSVEEGAILYNETATETTSTPDNVVR